MAQGRHRVGLAAWQWAAVGNLWIGWHGVQGGHRMEQANLTEPMQLQYRSYRERV